METESLKKQIEKKIADPASFPKAYRDFKEYLRKHRAVQEFHFGHKVLGSFESDPKRDPFVKTVKLAVLASHTVDFLYPLLKTDLMLEDIRCDLYKPKYNQFRQEIFDRASGLFAFQPDITVVALELEDVFPNHISEFPAMPEEKREDFFRQALSLYESIVASYHANARGSILLVQGLVAPFQSFRTLERKDDDLLGFVERLNQEVSSLCKRHSNTRLLDYSSLVSRYGSEQWTDPRLYYTARIPIAPSHWLHMSDAYVRYIKAVLGLDLKCIVLDLDNTLWGGVLGEEGIEGIQLGETFPGSVFRKFQEYLLSLHANGYILAVNSKNNLEDVLAVLNSHKWMILRESHFAAIKANWNGKPENISEISAEINILPEHMLFVDDDPVEIEKVRLSYPALTCMQVESPPLNFAAQFKQLRCFGKLGLTDEDKQRGGQYIHERKRRELRESIGSIDDFLSSLSQRMTVYRNERKHVKRIAQLTQKTNQFNMTTLRLTEAEVEAMLDDPRYQLITAELSDKFGDSGIIAYVQIRTSDRSWRIENFLMSCRVLGRTVEESLLHYIVQLAGKLNIDKVWADFRTTKKNSPFSEFYLNNGFVETGRTPNEPADKKQFVCTPANREPRKSFVEIVDNAE